MPDFDNFDLQSSLDQEAFNILSNDNSNLVFGGSSAQEAEIFGRDISASDAPRVGAFLGGVALANLKVQQRNQERFQRVQALNEQLSNRRREELNRDKFNETVRSNTAGERQADARITNDARNTTSLIENREGSLAVSERNAATNEKNQTFREAQAGIENSLANRTLSETERQNNRQNILAQQDNIIRAASTREKEQRSILLLRSLGVPDNSILASQQAGDLISIAEGLLKSDVNAVARGTTTASSNRNDPAAVGTPGFTQDGFRNLGTR